VLYYFTYPNLAKGEIQKVKKSKARPAFALKKTKKRVYSNSSEHRIEAQFTVRFPGGMGANNLIEEDSRRISAISKV
jgi:hypothetical protein